MSFRQENFFLSACDAREPASQQSCCTFGGKLTQFMPPLSVFSRSHLHLKLQLFNIAMISMMLPPNALLKKKKKKKKNLLSPHTHSVFTRPLPACTLLSQEHFVVKGKCCRQRQAAAAFCPDCPYCCCNFYEDQVR